MILQAYLLKNFPVLKALDAIGNCPSHLVYLNIKIVYKYWVAQSGEAEWNETVQILPSDNIPSIPRFKATKYLFYITDRSLSFNAF